MTAFKPLFDRVLVRPIVTDRTPGGLHLPAGDLSGSAREGEVVAVGPGSFSGGRFVETTVKVGARVLFSSSESEVKIDGVAHLVIYEDDIYGILE